MQNVEWGEYRLGDLFKIDNTWIYGKNKQWQTRFKTLSNGRLPVISGITVNNGINYYTEDKPKNDEVFADSLTISTRGEYSGTVTYHSGEFVLANNILAMPMPKLNKKHKLFIGSIINNLNYGGYNNYPKIETLKNDKIYLPTKNGKIDYDFMEKYITEQEEEIIDKLYTYLKVNKLYNYNLSDAEQKVLKEYDSIEFADYDITKIFDIRNTKNILSREITENSGNTPYLCASTENNAVSSYISYDESKLDKGNCIFIGGKTFVVTYQEKDFYSNDSHNLVLYFKNHEATKLNQLYLVTCVNKSLSYKYSWGNSVSNAKIKSDLISLPTKNGKPDFETMEIFISAIQKLVIKNVVCYTQKKHKTKKMCKGDNQISS